MPVPVLLYHGVTSEAPMARAEYSVSPEAFAEQMAYLAARRYTTVSLFDVVKHVVSGAALPDRAIAITFDDGYLDVYSNVFPTLERHNFTATVFVVAERVGGTAEWDSVGLDPPAPLMSWAHIKEMIGKGIAFESHSCTHPDLTTLDEDAARREIKRSRIIIQENTGAPVKFFAYPHSRFNRALQELVMGAGYLAACSSDWGLNDYANSIFALPRLMVLRQHDLGYFKWMVDLGLKHPWYCRIFKGKRTLVHRMFKRRLPRDRNPGRFDNPRTI